jgi:hypothetical protein
MRLTYQKKLSNLKEKLSEITTKENIIIYEGDARLGHNFAIAEKGDKGTINLLSTVMPYSELMAYMNGFISYKNNYLKI